MAFDSGIRFNLCLLLLDLLLCDLLVVCLCKAQVANELRVALLQRDEAVKLWLVDTVLVSLLVLWRGAETHRKVVRL